jgi:hypothetical protein
MACFQVTRFKQPKHRYGQPVTTPHPRRVSTGYSSLLRWEKTMILSRLSWLLVLLTAYLVVRPTPPSPPPHALQVEYKQLINSDPNDAARILRQIYPVTVAVDSRTCTVIIKGEPYAVATSVSTLDKIECVANCGPDPDIFFIRHLHNAQAQNLAPILNDMTAQGFFPAGHQLIPPTFLFDNRLNALIVHTDRNYEDRVREIIDELDRPLNPVPQQEIRIEHGLNNR